jgi:hypothetical protein
MTLKIGVALWSQATNWPGMAAAARQLDVLGYDHVWTWDHIYAPSGDPYQPVFEGWTIVSALAAITEHVELGLFVGANTFRNLLLFHNNLTAEIFRKQWLDACPPKDQIEGLTLPDARVIKQAVPVPVICTGGFQTASVIRKAILDGDCDGVSMARPLVANNDLVKQFAAGKDRADKPCTYCNKCLVHVVEHPIGCYEESRYPSIDAMYQEIMSVFVPSAFS